MNISTINKLILKFRLEASLILGSTIKYVCLNISIADHLDDDHLAEAPPFINYVPKSW